MTESTPAKVAADKARALSPDHRRIRAIRQGRANARGGAGLAEKNIAQTREFYERSKDAFDKILESWEKTFDAAGQGAVALNRKMIDITQRNINSGFEFAKSLIGAKTMAEVMALHSNYWQKQLGTLRAQADEMRELSTRVTADVVEPVKAQVKRGIDQIERTQLTSR